MDEEGMDYPFHLGVTEAGDGEEGRVKSAIGIGSLLEDGIGDTIRVSLTEDAVHEIPAAQAIARPYNARLTVPAVPQSASLGLHSTLIPPQEQRNPYGYRRRVSDEVRVGTVTVGGAQPVRVELATRVPLVAIDATLEQVRALGTGQWAGTGE
jgi:(E)-4-hydroxy-3-methylbut-2-enyl-diphosphate synthase